MSKKSAAAKVVELPRVQNIVFNPEIVRGHSDSYLPTYTVKEHGHVKLDTKADEKRDTLPVVWYRVRQGRKGKPQSHRNGPGLVQVFKTKDGEETIALTTMTIQDGSWNAIATLTRIGYPIIVMTRAGHERLDAEDTFGLNDSVTEMLDELFSYSAHNG